MKRIVSAAAVVAAVGTLLAGTAAVAAPAGPGGDQHATGVRAVRPAAAVPATPAKGAVPATYNNACGSGYSVIDTLTLVGGHVYLTYNRSNGYNCVTTVRNTAGSAIWMDAWIERADGTGTVENYGDFTTYAGPVYLHAAGSCINWGGIIGESSDLQLNTHCG